MPKTCTAELAGRTLVIVHSEQDVDPAEWTAVTAQMGLRNYQGVVVFTAGASLNATQRTDVRRAFEHENAAPIAVLTDSRVVIGILGVLGLFVRGGIKGFSIEAPTPALDFARVASPERPNVLMTVHRLCAELGTRKRLGA